MFFILFVCFFITVMEKMFPSLFLSRVPHAEPRLQLWRKQNWTSTPSLTRKPMCHRIQVLNSWCTNENQNVIFSLCSCTPVYRRFGHFFKEMYEGLYLFIRGHISSSFMSVCLVYMFLVLIIKVESKVSKLVLSLIMAKLSFGFFFEETQTSGSKTTQFILVYIKIYYRC